MYLTGQTVLTALSLGSCRDLFNLLIVAAKSNNSSCFSKLMR